MQLPFFSIIIPCYNARTYIDKALDALEKQSYTNFEVICIDDCSTDDTYKYLQQRSVDSGVTIYVYRNVVNKGPGESRNVGIAHAKGQYIGFCDSDDWFEKDALEIIHRKLDKYQYPVDILFFNFFRVFPSGKKQHLDITSAFSAICTTEDYVAFSPDSLWCSFINRELLTKVPIAGLYNAEDMVTVPVLISKARQISCLQDALYNYFYRTSSLSTSIDPKVIVNFENAYKYLKANIGLHYQTALEFHGIKMIVYGLLYNAIRCKLSNKKLKEKILVFEREFPLWFNNHYIKMLPLRKRIWCYLVKHRVFCILRLYYYSQWIYFKLFSI